MDDDSDNDLPPELRVQLEGLLPAARVAAKREELARLERRLRELQAAAPALSAPREPHESEDAQLAAEVEALSVRATSLENARTPAAALLAALVAALAAPPAPHAAHAAFLHDHLRALQVLPAAHAHGLAEEIIRGIAAALAGEGAGEAWLAVAAWLAAACVWAAPRPQAARVLLHRALRPCSRAQVEELARVLAAAMPSASELLELSDAVRGDPLCGAGGAEAPGGGAEAPGGGAEALGALLLRAALARLLHADVRWEAGALTAEEMQEALAPQWSALPAVRQLLALRLAARALAHTGPAPSGHTAHTGPAPSAHTGPARLVRALDAAHPPSRQVQVQAALSKLKLLFVDK